jgi:hypothetical protein
MLAPVIYDPNYYWAAAAGRLSNYQGWYLRIEAARHVYCTIDGFGADPGLAVPELAGSTGAAVALTGGQSASAAATTIAAAIALLPNWGGTSSTGPTLELDGPAAAAQSVDDWDARGNDNISVDERNGLLGMDTHRYDAGSGMVNGPLNTLCVSQHMTVPAGGTRRVFGLQVYIGAWSAASAERAHWALYVGTSTTNPVTGSALLYDFGQELASFSANGWHTLWVDEDTLVEIDAADEIWLTAYGEGTTTTHGVCNNGGAAFIGDWTDQNHVNSTSTMPTDATTAAPAAHAGTTATGYAGVFQARLICEIAPFAGRGELGSIADPMVVGHHVDFTDAELDANAVLTQSVIMPDVGPTRPVGLDMSVGTSHDGTNQPRGFVYDGADFVTDPAQPDIDGATLVRDFGRMAGTTVSDWVSMLGGSEAEVANEAALVWGIVHAGSAGGTVTNIAYIAGEISARANADPIDAPMDWIMVDDDAGATDGPEVALIADGSSNFDVDNPGVGSLPGTIGTYTPGVTALYFPNIGGIRGFFRCEGVLAA